MFTNYPVNVSIPAKDMQRAKSFFAEKLGLTPLAEHPFAIIYNCGGTRISIVPSNDAGKAGYSLMTWLVDDIDIEIASLKAKGVIFEEYDFAWLKTVNSKAIIEGDQIAWFKDSEGNLLAIAELKKF